MRQSANPVHQHPIEALQDAIELGGMVSGQFSHRSLTLQVPVELPTQELAAAIGVQDFDSLAVLLCDCPGLEHLVGREGLVFQAEGEGDGVPSCIICEGNEILSALACSDGGWPPYIGMCEVSEVRGWRADSDFRNWLVGGSGVYAGVAVCFLGVWIQFDPCDRTAVN